MNPAATPVPVEDVQGDGRWMSIHKRYVNESKDKEPDICSLCVFIGDSLIQLMAQTDVWFKWFVPMHCLNFGIGGDATQHVLWRLQNGELDDLKPKVIVILAGTNNHGHTAEQVVGGLKAIVETVSTKQPQAQIFVMSIPPRGHEPNPLREKIRAINDALPNMLKPFENTQFVECDNGFIQADGTIDHNDMYDYLHLTKQGYEKLCAPLYEALTTLLSP
ncbi:platelet-activating factor acetylhydrolase IB subunit alpha1-like [Ptychodera flava]|uniref:platelet-activating factor acetylhydrolase IB subunit alpha1-like n=1 Tax=Ptychodera flava TaxID=63121 RepID=UPI003969CC37